MQEDPRNIDAADAAGVPLTGDLAVARWEDAAARTAALPSGLMVTGDSTGADPRRPTRVLIADDHELVRAGFHSILADQADIVVVGEAKDGFDAVDLARRRTPDVVLMDIQMPGLDGLEAARRILCEPAEPPIAVLMLTTFDLNEYVYDALRAGASGFLLKDVLPEQLVAAVRIVAAGDALIAPAITKRLVAEFARAAPKRAQPPGFAELTPRELEVLRLVARGLSNAEIAAVLFVGESTIKTHMKRMLAKLGLRDRVQAVVAAYEAGLVTPGD